MIDAHIHLALNGSSWAHARDRHKNAPDEAWVAQTLIKYAQAGFSYVRDGGDAWGVSSLAARLAPKYGIAYATPAFALFPRGHYGSILGRAFANFQEYCQLVHEAQTQGATFVKLMLSGILDFNIYGAISSPGLPTSEVKKLVDYAHAQGMAVMAHVNTSSLVAGAILAGADSIEHGLLINTPTQNLLCESGVVWVPTLCPVFAATRNPSFSCEVSARIYREHEQAVSYVAVHGGIIAPGSDAGSSGVTHVHGGAKEYDLLTALPHVTADVLRRGTRELITRFPAFSPLS